MMRNKAIRSIVVVMIAALVFTTMPLGVFAASKNPGKAKITSFKVGKVSKKTSKTTVTIKWKKVSKATGYEIWAKHGTGKWRKLKTAGRIFSRAKISNVVSGRYSVKIRAIRKYKGKTYKGKFSKVKTKFIKSPLTLQQFGNKYPAIKKSSDPSETISFSANMAIFKYDISKIPEVSYVPKEYWESPEGRTALYDMIGKEYSKTAVKDKNNFKYNTGVSNVTIKIRFTYGSTSLIDRTF